MDEILFFIILQKSVVNMIHYILFLRFNFNFISNKTITYPVVKYKNEHPSEICAILDHHCRLEVSSHAWVIPIAFTNGSWKRFKV